MLRKPNRSQGTAKTSRALGEVLEGFLTGLRQVQGKNPEMVLSSWPEVIGDKLAKMTEATRFFDGVLHVTVKNSTLHSILSGREKMGVLRKLRQMFPSIEIKTIEFRIG